ncbi:GTPase IMAP family member 4-like [Lepisosteus oculatus]|uniref:GTPase IMAP family member 4-like n=1 Tax=Lepisosteus oculatus TaxID=7918 RepID=UPI0035F50DBB
MATAGGEGQVDSHEAPQRLSEIRIVLLGGRKIGKCSSGNTILGREEFRPGRKTYCVRRQGEVAGRRVTAVYTPGWTWRWWAPAQATPEHIRQEVVYSLSLCPPGPHAFLLVIPVDSPFTENHRRSAEKHLELLTERVWRHTMVLFTQAHALRDTTIEQHIERAGEELQRLVEKCGNRYHVLNNRYRGDRTQVTELLEKVEQLVRGNRGQHFTPKSYQQLEQELEALKEFRRCQSMTGLPPNMREGGAPESSPGLSELPEEPRRERELEAPREERERLERELETLRAEQERLEGEVEKLRLLPARIL